MRVLVAGVGNLLRGDDGFGVAVARALDARPLPEGAELLEVGIGGIHLVQELLVPTDGLVIVDAAELGREPGTVAVISPDVVDAAEVAPERRRDLLADMHYAAPGRALMLARGLGVLPERVLMVCCQPGPEHLGEGLSPPVRHAVPGAATEVERILATWLASRHPG